jgi:hypothetical protein
MLSPMSKKKFDRIYGKGSAEQVANEPKRMRTVMHHQNHEQLPTKEFLQDSEMKP